MAARERAVGVASTYFVRAHSEYYSLARAAERAKVRALASAGHETD